MALTVPNTPKLRGNGQPFQLWEVQVMLDGSVTSGAAIAHGIPGNASAFKPDYICRIDGGTASTSAAVIQNCSAVAASAGTHFTLVLAGAGDASATINLGFFYFNQF